MTGDVVSLTQPSATHRRTTMLHTIAFVAGFSLVFIVGWGGAATLLGGIFSAYKTELAEN